MPPDNDKISQQNVQAQPPRTSDGDFGDDDQSGRSAALCSPILFSDDIETDKGVGGDRSDGNSQKHRIDIVRGNLSLTPEQKSSVLEMNKIFIKNLICPRGIFRFAHFFKCGIIRLANKIGNLTGQKEIASRNNLASNDDPSANESDGDKLSSIGLVSDDATGVLDTLEKEVVHNDERGMGVFLENAKVEGPAGSASSPESTNLPL